VDRLRESLLLKQQCREHHGVFGLQKKRDLSGLECGEPVLGREALKGTYPYLSFVFLGRPRGRRIFHHGGQE
jgi:hypothetical protein